MADSLKSNPSKEDAVEKKSNFAMNTKITEIHPLAFTIEFDDQKFDENKKSKVRERLNAFALKHRRNPSLPDFREVKNDASCPPAEAGFSVHSQPEPVLHKRLEKCGKIPEARWKSSALKAAKNMEIKTPFSFKENLAVKKSFIKSLKIGRRYSLDGMDDIENTNQLVNLSSTDSKVFDNNCAIKNDDVENKSDTVSEAGTYTVDKDEEAENDANKTHILEINEIKENVEYLNGTKRNNCRNWINEWVRDVEEQNLLKSSLKKPTPMTSRNVENANSSCGISKIPSPLNTLGRKTKLKSMKPSDGNKYNGSIFHRSSSLSAKDFNENHGSESSLETESFLNTTQSVMASMQNRIKYSLERGSSDLGRAEKRNYNYQERPHPPSNASDTDTNSETDIKTFKKPIGNPFTSARLNRAFSLRRAKVDPEKDSTKTKPILANNNVTNTFAKQGLASKVTASKPPSSIPFSRLDCGRFSMRSTLSNVRTNVGNQVQKKEMKKSATAKNGGNRSSSSLSSREVEFQNWRRRKSFDPMKAAAEGRKKELAKRAAMNQPLNVGSDSRIKTRHSNSPSGNAVLRSASFHSTAQVMGDEEDEGEAFQEQGSTDEQESTSSHLSNHQHSRLHNSSSQLFMQCRPSVKTSVLSSRGSLVSETHSSPSRRLRTNDLEDLVLSAISEASYKLKLKSCKLLKKLNYLYDGAEEKSIRLKDEVAILESDQNFGKNSSVRQDNSRDLSAILKNLKGVENVFRVLEDILFDEDLNVYVNK